MSVDAEIEGLLAAGDHGRAAELVMRCYGPGVRGLLITLFRKNRDAAEDAFSLFAENLWRHIGTFRGESSVKTWVYRIGRNAALSVGREAWRRRKRRLDTEDAERLAEEVRTQTGVRLERQSEGLASLRDSLDLDEQTLLTLRLDEKLAWEEIAAIMAGEGEPVDAAALRKRFERLKRRLGELARERGLLG
jgi:RNA polymerase sigma-70 factor (ECF subfamily)